jgi:hypothetical protein
MSEKSSFWIMPEEFNEEICRLQGKFSHEALRPAIRTAWEKRRILLFALGRRSEIHDN